MLKMLLKLSEQWNWVLETKNSFLYQQHHVFTVKGTTCSQQLVVSSSFESPMPPEFGGSFDNSTYIPRVVLTLLRTVTFLFPWWVLCFSWYRSTPTYTGQHKLGILGFFMIDISSVCQWINISLFIISKFTKILDYFCPVYIPTGTETRPSQNGICWLDLRIVLCLTAQFRFKFQKERVKFPFHETPWDGKTDSISEKPTFVSPIHAWNKKNHTR